MNPLNAARPFFVVSILSLSLLVGQKAGPFEHVASYRGYGSLTATVVAPGSSKGSERIYGSYLYENNTFDIVAVDPRDGTTTVYPNPVRGEFGAWAMVLGPDHKLYIGTLPNAHLLQLDPKHRKFVDLGRPSPTEQYIWALCVASDGKIYGSTYPSAKLVRYDPKTRRMDDLGRMDPVEQYGRFIAASNDGFVYVGIGTNKSNIAAWEIATGKHSEILPPQYQEVYVTSVFRNANGDIFGRVKSQYFRLMGWDANPISPGDHPPREEQPKLHDGRIVTLESNVLKFQNQDSNSIRLSYPGNILPLFRLATGPSETVYGSSILPMNIVRFDDSSKRLATLGAVGGGEVYSFLRYDPYLLLGTYGGKTPLLKFDTRLPFSPDATPANPLPVNFTGGDAGWRPQAMITGADGKVYIGSVGGYGKLDGALTVWDVKANSVASFPGLVHEQGIASLAAWHNLVIGGSTTSGGGGSHPTQHDAALFIWDPVRAVKTFEITPVPGASEITDLIAAPNGLVFGIAGKTLFAFDPEQKKLDTAKQVLPFGPVIYNAIASGRDQRIWGLSADGVFNLDAQQRAATLAATTPCKVSAGFALTADALYFACESELWRFILPNAVAVQSVR